MTERLKLWLLTTLMFVSFAATIWAGAWAVDHGHARVIGYVLLGAILIPCFGMAKLLAEEIIGSR